MSTLKNCSLVALIIGCVSYFAFDEIILSSIFMVMASVYSTGATVIEAINGKGAG